VASATQPDLVVIHRAAIRGAVIGLAQIADLDFDQVAAQMPTDQLLAARSELDKAAQIIGNWGDALDAALDLASEIEELPPPEQIVQEQLPAPPSEHDGVR
jgi:hypothetical protein